MSAKKGRENERGVALTRGARRHRDPHGHVTEFQDEATGELSAALADRDARQGRVPGQERA